MNKQLIVRCEEGLIRQLKIMAAHQNESMAEVVRTVLDREVTMERTRDESLNLALKAANL